MKAYSVDLRERVVASIESGECNIPAAARRFKVSEPTIERWVARKRRTGMCAPLPHTGGPLRRLAGAEAVIRTAVKAQPDATLEELCEVVEKETKIRSNSSMMCRELARLKLPRKKSRSMPASGTRRL
ncbi:MAG TPA: transposase [Anaerolineales bacterium]